MDAAHRILACDVVASHTGLQVLHAAPIVGRGDVNQVHVVTTGDGVRFVVRSHQRAELDRFRKETWSIERAREAGVPSPPVLALGASGTRAWMLQPFVAGVPGHHLPRDAQERLWRSMGRLLGRIHAVPVGGFGETLAAMTTGGDARWRDYLAYNLGELNRRDPLLALNLLGARAQTHLRSRFERLAARPARLGLCHGDLSPRNVIDRDRVVSVIDWGCASGHLVPHYDLGVILSDSLDEQSREFAALLDGYGLSLDAYHHEVREDVATLRLLVAVDKVRWALDRKPARLPALAARLSAELSTVT